MTMTNLRSVLLLLLPAIALFATQEKEEKEKAIPIQYLEIVTPKVDETVAMLEKIHGVKFSELKPELGNARTASLVGGGQIGVRAPMRESEEPVVRPYLRVKGIDAAVKVAKEAGGEIAMYPTPIPGAGKFSIYFLGDIQHALWEL